MAASGNSDTSHSVVMTYSSFRRNGMSRIENGDATGHDPAQNGGWNITQRTRCNDQRDLSATGVIRSTTTRAPRQSRNGTWDVKRVTDPVKHTSVTQSPKQWSIPPDSTISVPLTCVFSVIRKVYPMRIRSPVGITTGQLALHQAIVSIRCGSLRHRTLERKRLRTGRKGPHTRIACRETTTYKARCTSKA